MEETDYDKLADEAGDRTLGWIDENMPPITTGKLKEIRDRLPTKEDRAAWDEYVGVMADATDKNLLDQALVKFAAAGTAGAVKLVKEALKAAT